jgi:hypothetical protein
VPSVPEEPLVPEIPLVPDEPLVPEIPLVPDEPLEPDVPDEPENCSVNAEKYILLVIPDASTS